MVKRKFTGRMKQRRPIKNYKIVRKIKKHGPFAGQIVNKVNRLYRMIETKEAQYNTVANVNLSHNNTMLISQFAGGALNPFATTQGTGDPMAVSAGNRVGDEITVKGLKIKAFFENALGRSRVYYRIMLLRGPRGDAFGRGTLFKGDSNNKMMDVLNTERYTVIAQRVFTINTQNPAPTSVDLVGVPVSSTPAGIGTRMISMWIPGRRFGRGGHVQYENAGTDLKFFDYRIVCLAYDWFGTPQDVNVVGKINELYTKLYFKDA